MDPSLQLLFDEIHRRFDELDVRMEQRFSRTVAALEQRSAAVELHTCSSEKLAASPLIVADNWGGFFNDIPAAFHELVPAPDGTSTDSEFSCIDGEAASIDELLLVPEAVQATSETTESPRRRAAALDDFVDFDRISILPDGHIAADNWGGEFEEIDPVPAVDSASSDSEIDAKENPLQIQESERQLEMVEVDEKVFQSIGDKAFKDDGSALGLNILARSAFSTPDPSERAPLRPPPLRRLRSRSPGLLQPRHTPLRWPRHLHPRRAPPHRRGRPLRLPLRGHRARTRPRTRARRVRLHRRRVFVWESGPRSCRRKRARRLRPDPPHRRPRRHPPHQPWQRRVMRAPPRPPRWSGPWRVPPCPTRLRRPRRAPPHPPSSTSLRPRAVRLHHRQLHAAHARGVGERECAQESWRGEEEHVEVYKLCIHSSAFCLDSEASDVIRPERIHVPASASGLCLVRDHGAGSAVPEKLASQPPGAAMAVASAFSAVEVPRDIMVLSAHECPGGFLLSVRAGVRTPAVSASPRASPARCSTLGHSHVVHTDIAIGRKPSICILHIDISEAVSAFTLARFPALIYRLDMEGCRVRQATYAGVHLKSYSNNKTELHALAIAPATLNAQVEFDQLQKRYITSLTSASWMGIEADVDQKALVEMRAQITMLLEPLLATQMSRHACLQLWQPTEAMLLCWNVDHTGCNWELSVHKAISYLPRCLFSLVKWIPFLKRLSLLQKEHDFGVHSVNSDFGPSVATSIRLPQAWDPGGLEQIIHSWSLLFAQFEWYLAISPEFSKVSSNQRICKCAVYLELPWLFCWNYGLIHLIDGMANDPVVLLPQTFMLLPQQHGDGFFTVSNEQTDIPVTSSMHTSCCIELQPWQLPHTQAEFECGSVEVHQLPWPSFTLGTCSASQAACWKPPWPSFIRMRKCSVDCCSDRLWKPPWFLQLGKHISRLAEDHGQCSCLRASSILRREECQELPAMADIWGPKPNSRGGPHPAVLAIAQASIPVTKGGPVEAKEDHPRITKNQITFPLLLLLFIFFP